MRRHALWVSVFLAVCLGNRSQGADITSDGCVDIFDFSSLSSQWLASPCVNPLWCNGSDLDGSGAVDIEDLNELAATWLDCPLKNFMRWLDRMTLDPLQVPKVLPVTASIQVLQQDWGSLKIDQSVLSTPLKIGTVSYGRGLGTHANAILRISLSQPAKWFRTNVGIDNNFDTAGFRGSAQFFVKNGTQTLAATGVLRGGNAPWPMIANITGLSTFDLVVTDAGDGISWDQSDFADARVEFEDGTLLYLPGDISPATNEFFDLTLLPFSFNYGGLSSDVLLPSWNRTLTVSQTSQGEERRLSFQEPASGLKVDWTVLLFGHHNAIDMKLSFENTGIASSPILKDVRTCRLFVPGPLEVVTERGGVSNNDFKPTRLVLGSQVTSHAIQASDGWSSNQDIPFWLMQKGSDFGLYFGLAWTGQWQCLFNFDNAANVVSLSAGMQNLDISLLPGERISQPSVLMGLHIGDRFAGHNALRRVLYDEYVPNLNGQKPLPPVSWNHWFTFNNGINESLLLDMVNAVKNLGLEYFVVDAGWFFYDFGDVGDWRVNPTKFPNGLEPIAQAVAAAGMKMGLWFEPERVSLPAYAAFEPKSWLLPTQDPGQHLLDLSLPEVRQWMVNLIGGYVTNLNLKWIRFDMNFPPLWMWLNNNPNANRLGLQEIRHVEGIYEVLDTLRANHPDLLIEWSAGGGRRIDLGSLSRSHTFWKSDVTGDGNVTRPHLTGGNLFIPGNYLNSNLISPLDSRYDYYTQYGGPLGFGRDFRNFNNSQKALAAQFISQYKTLRHFLLKDYYPLFADYPTDQTQWDGWQFHDPDTDSGFFLLFRLPASPDNFQSVMLRGLNANKTYILTPDQTSNLPPTATGQTLMNGVSVNIAAPKNALLIQYQ